jgi:hypothetical protein
MCNIGIAASAEEINVTNTNTWHIPVDEHDDAFVPLDAFFKDPLGRGTEIPAFITFPSTKVQHLFCSICHQSCRLGQQHSSSLPSLFPVCLFF